MTLLSTARRSRSSRTPDTAVMISRPPPPGPSQPTGTCAPGWEHTAGVVARAFAADRGLGGAVHVLHHGRPVVDLWTGTDADGRPWTGDRLGFLYSAGKPLAAAAALVLARAGALDPAAPVAVTWPGYAARGKHPTTVTDLLTHQSGLPVLPAPLTGPDVLDWQRWTDALERADPWWEPGTATGYQGTTHGHLLGETVRLANRTATFSGALRALVTGPCALDVHCGLPPDQHHRVGRPRWATGSDPATPTGPEPDGPLGVAVAVARAGLPGAGDTAGWTAELPSRNVLASARGLAGFWAACLDGRLPGTAMAVWQPPVFDRVLRLRAVWGAGVARGHGRFDRGSAAYGHPGAGGAVGWADPGRGLAFAFVPAFLRPAPFGRDRRAALLTASVLATADRAGKAEQAA